MINPIDIKAGMVLGHADAQMLREALSDLNRLVVDVQNYSEMLRYHIDRQAKAENELADLKKQEPFCVVVKNNGSVSVELLNGCADGEFELFARPVPSLINKL